jgi:hypothetical protein
MKEAGRSAIGLLESCVKIQCGPVWEDSVLLHPGAKVEEPSPSCGCFE